MLSPYEMRAEIAAYNIDYVVHLAAMSHVAIGRVEDYYRVNVLGTEGLLQALGTLHKLPQAVLLASSANVYGNCDSSPIAEDQAPAPINHYAISKLAIEHVARMYADKLRIVVVRPFNYTGVGQAKTFLIPKLVKHFAKCSPTIELGNLKVQREFNDVRSVCTAYAALLKADVAGQTFNVCSGHPVSLLQVVGLLEELTGHKPELKINPTFVRPNEVHSLCGNPDKLYAAIGPVAHPHLRDTLKWMLDAVVT